MLGLAWAWGAHARTQVVAPVPAQLAGAAHAPRDAQLPDLEYLLARMGEAQPAAAQVLRSTPDAAMEGGASDLRMNLRHYNVDPKLVAPETREMLWPSLVLQVIFLLLLSFLCSILPLSSF